MAKVHIIACQTFPHFLCTAGSTARAVAHVEGNPKAGAEFEAARMIRSISTGKAMRPTFEAGRHICQIVDDGMESSRLGPWVSIA